MSSHGHKDKRRGICSWLFAYKVCLWETASLSLVIVPFSFSFPYLFSITSWDRWLVDLSLFQGCRFFCLSLFVGGLVPVSFWWVSFVGHQLGILPFFIGVAVFGVSKVVVALKLLFLPILFFFLFT